MEGSGRDSCSARDELFHKAVSSPKPISRLETELLRRRNTSVVECVRSFRKDNVRGRDSLADAALINKSSKPLTLRQQVSCTVTNIVYASSTLSVRTDDFVREVRDGDTPHRRRTQVFLFMYDPAGSYFAYGYMIFSA